MIREVFEDADVLFAVSLDLQLDRFARDGVKALFAGLGDHAFVLGELCVQEMTVLVDELALGAGDLQTVRARVFARRRDEHTRRAVCVLRHSRHVVLDLDVVVLADRAVCEDPLRHTEDPLPQVQIVRALVQKHTAAFTSPCRTPSAAVVVGLRAVPVRDDPDAALQLAQLAALYHLAHLLIELVRSLIVHDPERKTALFRLVHEFVDLLRVYADRLLAQHVDARVKGVHADDGVPVVRRRDHDRVDIAGREHLLVVGVIRHRVSADGPCPVQSRRLDVADRRQNRPRYLAAK